MLARRPLVDIPVPNSYLGLPPSCFTLTWLAAIEAALITLLRQLVIIPVEDADHPET